MCNENLTSSTVSIISLSPLNILSEDPSIQIQHSGLAVRRKLTCYIVILWRFNPSATSAPQAQHSLRKTSMSACFWTQPHRIVASDDSSEQIIAFAIINVTPETPWSGTFPSVRSIWGQSCGDHYTRDQIPGYARCARHQIFEDHTKFQFKCPKIF